jgi:hypothetical protein
MSEGNISFQELEVAATQMATVKPPEQTATTTTAEVKAEETKPQFTDADVEAYKSLVDMGITPQNAAEFKAAKTALDNLPALLENNPDLLMDEIEKNNPALHKQLLERMSDRWFNRLPPEVKNANGNGSSSRTAESAPAADPRISAIEAKLDRFIQKENQEETARKQAAISDGYKNSLDGLLTKLPESVSQRDKDYIRLKANEMMWNDPKARDRIAQGVYVDVPTYFAKASSLVTAETKAASQAEHDRRAGVESRGSKQIPPAAENVNGASVKPEGHGKDPIWGDITAEELKSAYK